MFCRLIRFSWHGASCLLEILRFSTVSLPEVQKNRGADVDFQAVWAHVSNQEHHFIRRGVSDWWRESVRKSVSVHQDQSRGSAILGRKRSTKDSSYGELGRDEIQFYWPSQNLITQECASYSGCLELFPHPRKCSIWRNPFTAKSRIVESPVHLA